ncbi:alkylphosphonate utilization operon protein PhnA [Psychrobacter sp. JCM 18900]|nr:alkylphosphonate utilization operon protein PhnA [Psychrobacter sp. JCM 18900]
MSLPNCPKCDAEYTYEDGALLVCPMCAHEWTAAETDAAQAEDQDAVIRDAVGNELQDGDAVTVIKDLKVKGSSIVIKVGTKAKSIRLLPDATDGHDIDCKLDGYGPMKLKSSVVKKSLNCKNFLKDSIINKYKADV